MFNNSTPIDRSYEEGTITEIDAKRCCCKVKTVSNKNVSNVRYTIPSGGATRSGSRFSPTMGDNVVIFTGLGYPIVAWYLPKSQSNEESNAQSISNDSTGVVDTGNFTHSSGNSSGLDVNKPVDSVAGDHIIQSMGGGILAVLRGGSILLRSSPMAEFFLSRWSSLARIVSDNFEHFTSISSDVIKNYRSRAYRYTGYAQNYTDAKSETYRYHEYTGDTSIAENVKTNYHSDLLMPPVPGSIIRKEQVTDPVSELMHHTLALDGTDEVVVKTADGGSFTRIKQTNGVVTITFNDTSLITLDTNSITVSRDGVTKTIHDATGIHMVESGGASAFLSGNVINLSAGTVNINGATNITGVTHVSGDTTIASGANTLALTSASTVSNTTISANIIGNLTGNATHASLATALG